MDYPSASQFAQASLGGALTPRAADLNSPMNMPSQERLTLQREANDVFEQSQRAHALLDMLTGVPSEQTKGSAGLMTLSSAIAAARNEVVRLAERLDGLVGAVGQL